jgi:hypothetical protein
MSVTYRVDETDRMQRREHLAAAAYSFWALVHGLAMLEITFLS